MYAGLAIDRFLTNVGANLHLVIPFYLIKDLIYMTYFYNIKKLQEYFLLLEVKDSLDVAAGKQIARTRINIKRVIGQLKEFRLLHYTLSLNLVDLLDHG